VRLSIVLPCFNEAPVLSHTLTTIQALLLELRASSQVVSTEIILVDDGSTDQTWAMIESFSREDQTVHGIKLSRNFGHQSALLAGLFHATGDAVISLDADLQDDPAVIAPMIDAYKKNADVVFGVREDRTSDSFFKRQSAVSYYKFMHFIGVNLVENHADFRLMSRRAISFLGEYRETNLFLRGLIPMLGLRSAKVGYRRSARAAGVSKYPTLKMISFAWQGITNLSVVPLRLITLAGLGLALGSLAITVWALWIGIFTEKAVPGWTSTVAPLYFLGGVQLLAIGIVGEYVAKIYMEAKRRPNYLVESVTAGLEVTREPSASPLSDQPR